MGCQGMGCNRDRSIRPAEPVGRAHRDDQIDSLLVVAVVALVLNLLIGRRLA